MPVIDQIAGPFLAFATAVIDRVFPDKEADAERRAQLLIQAQQIDAQAAQAQAAIDQAEAQSQSLFVAGWRPYVGWCCGTAFAYHMLLQPFMAFVMAACGHSFPLPDFDTGTLNTVLMGMLGMSGLRTIEKIKGIS